MKDISPGTAGDSDSGRRTVEMVSLLDFMFSQQRAGGGEQVKAMSHAHRRQRFPEPAGIDRSLQNRWCHQPSRPLLTRFFCSGGHHPILER